MNTTLLDQISAITEVSARHWQPFDATSPGGIAFAGYLCRREMGWVYATVKALYGIAQVAESAGPQSAAEIVSAPQE